MPATIIDGEKIAGEVKAELRKDIEGLKTRGITPGLAAVIVGEDPGSMSYMRSKTKACEEMGIFSLTEKLPDSATEDEILALVRKQNSDPRIHGIIVQVPLPRNVSEQNVMLEISPAKDVDGVNPVNVGKLMTGEPDFVPCTPRGVQEMLVRSGNDPGGKHVVIVGRSNVVGKPLANILMQKKQGANATVTVCHTGTKELARHTLMADILVAAAGMPKIITADMVRSDAVVIDVGMNRVADPTAKRGYRYVGDVDFETVRQKVAAISPVPGGVGPMTIAMLISNTVTAAKRMAGSP